MSNNTHSALLAKLKALQSDAPTGNNQTEAGDE
jgi:hypothetical protein